MPGLEIQPVQGGAALVVKVVPASSKTTFGGILDCMLKVKVAAPPEKGKANEALVALLAQALGVKKAQIAITRGQANPVKHVTVSGLSAHDLQARLAAHGVPSVLVMK
jgi:uncharacterized protein (TIGR00251 family)